MRVRFRRGEHGRVSFLQLKTVRFLSAWLTNFAAQARGSGNDGSAAGGCGRRWLRGLLLAIVAAVLGCGRLAADASPLYLETLFGRKPTASTQMVADRHGHFFSADYRYNQVCVYTLKSGSRPIAGSASAGFRDGVGSEALFYGPWAIARSEAGNLYVTDALNSSIRRVSMDGRVTTVAGKAPGSPVGSEFVEMFSFLNGIAVDREENLYVTAMSSLHKVARDGAVTTLARPTPGALFGPVAVTVDRQGNPCVSDSSNRQISRLERDGRLTRIAGYPTRDASVRMLMFDAEGVLYILSTALEDVQPRVWRLEAGGTWRALTAAGHQWLVPGVEGDIFLFARDGVWQIEQGGNFKKVGPASQAKDVDGEGTDVLFDEPSFIAGDKSGNFYVTSGNRVRKIDPQMRVTTLAGGEAGYVDGPGAAARFRRPLGVATDPAGNVYVADYGNHVLRLIRPEGSVTTVLGNGTTGTQNGTVAVAEGRLTRPLSLAVDSTGVIYFLEDRDVAPIRKIAAGMVSTINFNLGHPTRLEVDGRDRLWVMSDVLAYHTPPSGFVWLANDTFDYGFRNGQGEAALMNLPTGIAVDQDGYIYVADTQNGAIRAVSPTGYVSTIAGNGDRGFRDGLYWRGACYPTDIAIDREGNLLITDPDYSTIRKGYRVSATATEPAMRWRTPAPMRPGVALTEAQLNATAAVPGVFEYLPAQGAVLAPGTHLVTAYFTPTDRRNYLPTFVATRVVVAESAAPAIAVQPQDAMVSAGEEALFSAVVAAAETATYRWQRWERQTSVWRDVSDGARYSGAATATLRLQRVTALEEGDRYRLVVTDGGGTVATNSAAVAIRGGFLVNMSTRAVVEGGDQAAIVGFVITGTEPKQVLVRAAGPALAGFGVEGALAEPRLRLFRGETEIAANAAWSGAANAAELKTVAARVGAFAWEDESKDSAILVTLPPGQYTAQVASGSGARGVTLIEVYGAEKTAAAPIVNISSRSLVRGREAGMTAGFVIQGNQAKRVLIRASGPALASLFGLSGTLADPVLRVYSGQTLTATQSGWRNREESISAAAARAGAFAWRAGSNDAAVLLLLPPGAYSAEVASASGGTGTALLEVYAADL